MTDGIVHFEHHDFLQLLARRPSHSLSRRCWTLQMLIEYYFKHAKFNVLYIKDLVFLYVFFYMQFVVSHHIHNSCC